MKNTGIMMDDEAESDDPGEPGAGYGGDYEGGVDDYEMGEYNDYCDLDLGAGAGYG